MKLLITGTPGVGKSAAAKELAKKLDLELVNEKEFCQMVGVGEFDKQEKVLEVSPKELEKELNKLLSKKKNVVVEGHVVCECKLNVDFVVLLRCDPQVLEERLSKRGYTEVKVQDNVFAEFNGYCKKALEKTYSHKKIVEVFSEKSIKETCNNIIFELKKRTKKGA